MGAPAGTVLDRILAQTRADLERRKRDAPIPPQPAEGVRRPTGERRFRAALNEPGVGVIAEFKRRSPSAGTLREAPDLGEMLDAYARGGAVAASILTEEPNFAGSLDDLRAARAACALPLLRKDFIVDPYQLHEAHAAGADAVLLIVAALEQPQLALLYDAARALDLDALVEVHDHAELQRALAVGADIVGVNNRDLRDFSVDVRRTETLMDAVPASVSVVSESGVADTDQVLRLARHGVQAVLVGEALMRSADPASTLRELSRATP